MQGAEHFEQRRAVRDARPYTRPVDLGRRVYRHVSADVYRTPTRTAEEIRHALLIRRAA